MTHHVLCPYCGHNFEADAPVEQDGWHLDPQSGRATFGSTVAVTRFSWVRILHTLASASPGIVKPDALLNRVSGGEDVNLVRVMLCQMRRQWPAGVPWPVENVRGHGYRWVW